MCKNIIIFLIIHFRLIFFSHRLNLLMNIEYLILISWHFEIKWDWVRSITSTIQCMQRKFSSHPNPSGGVMLCWIGITYSRISIASYSFLVFVVILLSVPNALSITASWVVECSQQLTQLLYLITQK